MFAPTETIKKKKGPSKYIEDNSNRLGLDSVRKGIKTLNL